MRTPLLVSCYLLICAPACALAQTARTAANWESHPAMVEIRAIYRKIARAETAGRLRKLIRKLDDACDVPPYTATERTLYVDARGSVRSYHFSGGSEDSAVQRALYYRQERLRFVLVKAGAVNGTRIEHRIYLSKSGKRLREEQKLLAGPGYTFPSRHWWEHDLVRNPRQAFNARPPCQGR